jgi:hypothetical protein
LTTEVTVLLLHCANREDFSEKNEERFLFTLVQVLICFGLKIIKAEKFTKTCFSCLFAPAETPKVGRRWTKTGEVIKLS